MKARFAEVPEAIQNTLEVAEKCNVEIESANCITRFFIRRNILLAKAICVICWPRDFTNVRLARAGGWEEFIIDRLEDPRASRLTSRRPYAPIMSNMLNPLPGERAGVRACSHPE